MTETVYVYIPGTGWAPAPEVEFADVTFRCGRKMRFERRCPEVGEMYQYTEIGLWDMEGWIEWAEALEFESTHTPTYRGESLSDENDYMVLVSL